MTVQQPYHAGFIVDDLDSAVADFETKLGYTFNPPTTYVVKDLDDRVNGTRGPVEIRVTYTREGPFRLEVIEARGDGIYARRARGIHHLGVWEPDPEARLASLEAAGDHIVGVVRQETGAVDIVYAASESMPDTLIEYVSEAQRERLEEWFNGAGL